MKATHRLTIHRFLPLVLSVAAPLLAAPAVLDSTTFTTGTFSGCPPQGNAGDPDLNRRKNRDVPSPTFTTTTVGSIKANHPTLAEAQGNAHRSAWTAAARAEVLPTENTGVSVEGFIIAFKREGAEGCNCGSSTRRDFHVWLSSGPTSPKSAAMVTEISPRLLPSHPTWNATQLKKLKNNHTLVRISGWLMWDQEHPDQVGLSRGTLWEIHPIHRIEVFSGGTFHDL